MIYVQEYILKRNVDGSCITVSDVHKVLLEMLKMIDGLCQSNDIPYYLVGGSALGAVRHKGFIPWDDDADIAMMREDYERFLQLLPKILPDGYMFQCFDTHKEYNVLIPAMKIRKRNTYVREANVLLANKCKDGDGLFIDVFVIDYVSERKWVDVVNRIGNDLLMPLIVGCENLNFNPLFLKKLFVNHAKHYGMRNHGSKYIGYDLTWTFYSPLKPIVYPKDMIYPVVYVPFMDTYLPVPNRVEDYLKIEIGETYMQFPPIDQQKPKHIVDIKL